MTATQLVSSVACLHVRQPPPTPVRAGTAALTTTIATVCPVFLVGGLSVQIGRDISMSAAGLGIVVAIYFTASSIVSVYTGRFVERVGVRRSGQIAISVAAFALAGTATATNVAILAMWMVVAGPANSLGQLASNSLLSRRIPARRQGLMFGVKQAAVPLSTTLAGISVPVIALTVGWRWAFGLAALIALTAILVLPSEEETPSSGSKANQRAPISVGLIIVTVSCALGATAANPLGTFIAEYGVHRGMSEAAAGVTVTIGGIAGVCARIGVGWIADRLSKGRLIMVAVMLGAGSVGLLILISPAVWAIPIGTALGFSLGWAWPGLLNFAISRLHPETPAAATGVTQTGVYLGGAFGPLLFGVITEYQGFTSAWITMAILMAAGAIGAVIGRRLLLRATP